MDEEEGGGVTIPIRQGWCQNLVSRKRKMQTKLVVPAPTRAEIKQQAHQLAWCWFFSPALISYTLISKHQTLNQHKTSAANISNRVTSSYEDAAGTKVQSVRLN